jgi:signal transduction histidine kinase
MPPARAAVPSAAVSHVLLCSFHSISPAADSLPPDTCKTVTTIRNSGARLLNLINDILDAAALRKVSTHTKLSLLVTVPIAC